MTLSRGCAPGYRSDKVIKDFPQAIAGSPEPSSRQCTGAGPVSEKSESADRSLDGEKAIKIVLNVVSAAGTRCETGVTLLSAAADAIEAARPGFLLAL
jgi:hypothetical protein